MSYSREQTLCRTEDSVANAIRCLSRSRRGLFLQPILELHHHAKSLYLRARNLQATEGENFQQTETDKRALILGLVQQFLAGLKVNLRGTPDDNFRADILSLSQEACDLHGLSQHAGKDGKGQSYPCASLRKQSSSR